MDWKQCRNRFLHCLTFGSGSWNVTWSESDTRNSLLSGSDTLCAMCHFLTCQFWHMPVLACQVLTPTGFYTVFKQFMPVLAHEPVLTLFPNWIPNCVLFEFMLGGWHVQMARGIYPPPKQMTIPGQLFPPAHFDPEVVTYLAVDDVKARIHKKISARFARRIPW